MFFPRRPRWPRWPRWRSALLSPLILTLMSCATNEGGAPHAPLPGTEACIFTVNLNDWTVIDNSTLIVYAPLRKDPYLVKLFAPIFDLQFRESLGFEDIEHNGQLCKDDYVVARGDAPQRTPITAVRALTPDQAKQIIAAAKQADTSKK
jgi:hypothetical protein